nr:hypothetical protein [Candidatus Sigynarchaeota archaeon]
MHPAVTFLVAFTVVMAILAFFKRIKVHGQHGIGNGKNEAPSLVVSD